MEEIERWQDLIDDYIFQFAISAMQKPIHILSINRYALNQLGYDEAHFKKLEVRELFNFREHKKSQEILNFHFKETTFEATIIAKAGRQIDLNVRTKIVKQPDKIIGLFIGRDIHIVKRKEDEVRFLNDELINQKENFEALIDNLTHTQEQLVQSEKMAALGQLIAGIAHEINTPLGAIKASIGNMNEAVNKLVYDTPKIMSELNPKEFELLFYLLKNTGVDLSMLSAKDARKIRREITQKLHNKNVPSADYIADTLALLEITEGIEELIPQLKESDSKKIFEISRNIQSLVSNKNTIHIAVEKASKVVFALKKFAHYDQSGEKISSDIIDGIETVLTLYNNQFKHGIELIRNYSELPPINCYFDEINQIWINLIQNAIQAMNNKGILTIHTQADEENITVIIEDTGSGIDPEIQHKIFDSFFTTKRQGEGSGIGLDIVKQIIDKHNGEIYFESILNKGTKFYIKLPLV